MLSKLILNVRCQQTDCQFNSNAICFGHSDSVCLKFQLFLSKIQALMHHYVHFQSAHLASFYADFLKRPNSPVHIMNAREILPKLYPFTFL